MLESAGKLAQSQQCVSFLTPSCAWGKRSKAFKPRNSHSSSAHLSLCCHLQLGHGSTASERFAWYASPGQLSYYLGTLAPRQACSSSRSGLGRWDAWAPRGDAELRVSAVLLNGASPLRPYRLDACFCSCLESRWSLFEWLLSQTSYGESCVHTAVTPSFDTHGSR